MKRKSGCYFIFQPFFFSKSFKPLSWKIFPLNFLKSSFSFLITSLVLIKSKSDLTNHLPTVLELKLVLICNLLSLKLFECFHYANAMTLRSLNLGGLASFVPLITILIWNPLNCSSSSILN